MRASPLVVYDESCDLCRAAVGLARRGGVRVRWVGAPAEMAGDSLSFVARDGRALRRGAAVSAVLAEGGRAARGAAGALRCIEGPADRVYDLIARHRRVLGAPLRRGRRVAGVVRRAIGVLRLRRPDASQLGCDPLA